MFVGKVELISLKAVGLPKTLSITLLINFGLAVSIQQRI